MRTALYCILLAFLAGCGNQPFVKHELSFKKTGDCKSIDESINMLSNINGERYELQVCMDADFDGKSYVLNRKGDSIVVNFPRSAAKPQALFQVTLDVDANPAYHHILLDGRPVTVVPYQ